MSRGGTIIEDVVSPLLKQVAEAKCLLASKHSGTTHNGFSAVDGLLGEFEEEVLLIKESFQRLDMWMKDVENELGVVAKQMDNILEGTTERRVLDSELQKIHKNISVLREHVTEALDKLHCNTSSVPAPCQGLTVNYSPTELHSVRCEVVRRGPTEFVRPGEFVREFVLPRGGGLEDNILGLEMPTFELDECLITMAIFPQASIIEKRLLIHWWVEEGLVRPTSNHMAEEIVDWYIRKISTGGLLFPVKRAHSSKVTHYRSLVREKVIIQAMLRKAFSFNSSGELIERLSSSPRACLTEPPTTEQYALEQPDMLATTSDFNPDNFTTCFNVDRHILRFKKKEFMSMRNATVLQLGRWQFSAKHHIEAVSSEFLEWLACFERLRYLSLRGISNIRKLPLSIGELTDLRILDLRACHNLESLPVEITMLKKLTYLDVSKCYLLDGMPQGLGSLQDLRVLKGFVIGNSRSRDPCRLGELARLEKLRKLSISIGHDCMAGRRDFHQLSQLRALRTLTITWGAATEPQWNRVSRAQPGRISAWNQPWMHLSPPPYLEKLDLRCFPGETAPEWLTSEKILNLQKLYIRGGGLCYLGVAAKLKSLEVLRLRFLTDFMMEEPELLKVFPRLVSIEIHQCNMLRSTVRSP